MNKYGVCNVCNKTFQPKIKNGKIIGMKYYCSELCYGTPIFKSVCKYCKETIIISGKELRQRRGKLQIICLNNKCLQKAKDERYSNINYSQIYKNSLKKKNCKSCNDIFIGGSLSLYCERCSYEMNHRLCINCGKEYELPRADSDLQVCKDCIVGEEQRYVGYCEDNVHVKCKFNVNCSRYFYYGSPQNKNCQNHDKCIHGNHNLFCQECSTREKVKLYNKLINQDHKIINENLMLISINMPDINKKIYNKICKTCKREFKGTGPTSNWCGCCYYVNKCEGCNNLFVTQNKDSFVCGQECSGIYSHKQNYNTNILKLNKNIIKIDLKPYTEITDGNLNDFKGISGIWFKSSNGTILDVCITKNIYTEVEYHIYALKNKINVKYLKISDYSNIKLYYLESFISWNEGLIKEFEFATKTNAIFWKPAPGIQMTLLSKLNK